MINIFLFTIWMVFCLVNPGSKTIEGKNDYNLKDGEHSYPVQKLLSINKTQQKYGWFQSLWIRNNRISPTWKTIFGMIVRGPNGEKYAIGSGIYNMRIEPVLIEYWNDKAADMLSSKGLKYLRHKILLNRDFDEGNVSMFVIDLKGNLLIDPAIPESFIDKYRNVLNLKGTVGNYPIKKLLKKLKGSDRGRVIYMTPRPGERAPCKKMILARKTKFNGKEYVICSELFIDKPLWM